MASNEAPIIIKRVKKGGGAGHHGGAWKVAYADFVTAMMAFFLLMWLINTTTPEQKRGIADYFAPASLSRTTSGSGGIMGGTVFGEEGARSGGSVAVVMRMSPPNPGGQAADGQSDASAQSDAATEEAGAESGISDQDKREFERAEISLRQAMQDLPDFAELSKHIMVDQTPEGLRIQIVDQEGRPMFAPGGAEPLDRTQRLLREVAEIIMKLPNRITISGHTDGAPFERTDGYSNWELSSDRANAARRILMEAGVPADRIFQISGKAGSEPLLPDDPFASSNRRISIVLLGEAPPLPPGHEP